MKGLSATEMQIMRSMLIKKYGSSSPFFDQLAAVQVEKRRLTGVGVFVDLHIPGNVAAVDQINTEICEDYRTLLDTPGDLVGFTLFIRNGYLSFLEGYTFGDVHWPDELLEKWLVLDAA